MLAKTVLALKADKAQDARRDQQGESGFLDRDLYPFRFNLSDGNVALRRYACAAQRADDGNIEKSVVKHRRRSGQ
jgi:hypothetical protein